MVWDLGSRERLANRSFKVWDLASCSMALQVWFLDLTMEVDSVLDMLLCFCLLSTVHKHLFGFLKSKVVSFAYLLDIFGE